MVHYHHHPLSTTTTTIPHPPPSNTPTHHHCPPPSLSPTTIATTSYFSGLQKLKKQTILCCRLQMFSPHLLLQMCPQTADIFLQKKQTAPAFKMLAQVDFQFVYARICSLGSSTDSNGIAWIGYNKFFGIGDGNTFHRYKLSFCNFNHVWISLLM
ncbi:hypothetical protein QVD17_16282 [Tagetes erecta]|uniref:Uncharacterized protein n=1 Tax=Tagetes erecta TaxID=13708 RepID=A0AAD8P0J4_TARER|nr:hypothetical protein QVD17_16282 [Tagetes erecta]